VFFTKFNLAFLTQKWWHVAEVAECPQTASRKKSNEMSRIGLQNRGREQEKSERRHGRYKKNMADAHDENITTPDKTVVERQPDAPLREPSHSHPSHSRDAPIPRELFAPSPGSVIDEKNSRRQ